VGRGMGKAGMRLSVGIVVALGLFEGEMLTPSLSSFCCNRAVSASAELKEEARWGAGDGVVKGCGEGAARL
jgi:hypothetical protein